mgnify:FL=1
MLGTKILDSIVPGNNFNNLKKRRLSDDNISRKNHKAKSWFITICRTLGNVSQACKVMGYSRDTFYRYKELYDQGGEEALFEMNRKKPCLKNRVPANVEDAVINMAVDFPTYGHERAANEIRKRGIILSGGGVRSIWLRNDLENFKKRLRALEAKVANDGIVLNDV